MLDLVCRLTVVVHNRVVRWDVEGEIGCVRLCYVIGVTSLDLFHFAVKGSSYVLIGDSFNER